MGANRALLLVTLAAAFAAVAAFPGAVPHDKEYVYHYNAVVRAGTNQPASYVSQFVLEGKLHLQSDGNSTFAHFADLHWSMYNGEVNHFNERKTKHIPVPKEVEDLGKVWRFVHDVDGKILAIGTEEHEKEFSRNIKKAVSSVFQLDKEAVEAQRPHAFDTEEHSIYGKEKVFYNVLPHTVDDIEVHKMHTVDLDEGNKFVFLNAFPGHSETDYQEPYSAESHRVYKLARNPQGVYIKHVKAMGHTYLHPFHGHSEVFFVSVNQTIKHMKETPVAKAFSVHDEVVSQNLTFHHVDFHTKTGAIPDITMGRSAETPSHHEAAVRKMLADAVDYLAEHHVEMKEPDVKHGQVINKMHRVLGYFDVEVFENVYNSLAEKTTARDVDMFHVFQEMVPHIGTKASTVFVRNIIRKKKVKDSVAVKMLETLPFHVRVPTVELLKEVEDMMTWGTELSEPVRKAGVLCFSSLVHKTFKHMHEHKEHHEEHHQEHHHHHNHQHDQEHHVDLPVDFHHELLDKYIKHFADKVKTTQDYHWQVVYMGALSNIKIGNVVQHLERIITGEEMNNVHLRTLAIWAAMDDLAQKPELAHKLLWPVMTDRRLHLEHRVAAYTVLMSATASMETLLKLHWYMKTEPCTDLYHYHYTTLKSLAESTSPVFADISVHAAQILPLSRKPYHRDMTANYLVDYTDPKYGYGGMAQVATISTNSTKIFYVQLTSQFFNVPFHHYSAYVKIHGLEPEFMGKHDKDKLTGNTFVGLENLVQVVSSIPHHKKIHIEYLIMHHEQVVRTEYYDHTNIKKLVEVFDNLLSHQSSLFKDSLHITYDALGQVAFPTDIGFPAVLEVKMPNVYQHHVNFTREVVNKVMNIHYEASYKKWTHYNYGVGFYNPIVDVWQGVKRIHSFDSVIPVNMNMVVNTQQQTVKITFHRYNNQVKDTIGFRSHVSNYVFVQDDDTGVLKQAHPEGHHWALITKGKEYRKDHEIFYGYHEDTGYKYLVAVYDNERHFSHGKFWQLLEDFSSKQTKNYEHMPFGHALLTLRNWYAFICLSPPSGSSGFVVKAFQDDDHKVTHVDVSMRYNNDIKSQDHTHQPAMKSSARLTYSVKSGDKVLHGWDVNVASEHNQGHTVKSHKVHLTEVEDGEKDYKVCLEATKRWVQENVDGHLTVSMGHSTDGKCVQDDVHVEVAMTGRQSEEQKKVVADKHHDYEECVNHVEWWWRHVPHHQTVECAAAHTSVRHFEYDVTLHKVPEHVEHKFYNWVRYLREWTIPHYYHVEDRHVVPVAEKHVKVHVEYPVSVNEMNVDIYKPHHHSKWTGVPLEDWGWVGFRPDNYHFADSYWKNQLWGWAKRCYVEYDILFNGHHLHYDHVPATYALYAGDASESHGYALYVKKHDEYLLDIKIVVGDNSVEIVPHGKSYNFVVNGKTVPAVTTAYHHESWFSYKIIPHLNSVVLKTHEYGIYIIFDGNSVRFEYPKFAAHLHGKCFTD